MNGGSGPNTETAKATRKVSLGIAATAIGWIGATWLGGEMGWSNRTRALFDLAALAGFVWCIWQIYGIWQQRRND